METTCKNCGKTEKFTIRRSTAQDYDYFCDWAASIEVLSGWYLHELKDGNGAICDQCNSMSETFVGDRLLKTPTLFGKREFSFCFAGKKNEPNDATGG